MSTIETTIKKLGRDFDRLQQYNDTKKEAEITKYLFGDQGRWMATTTKRRAFGNTPLEAMTKLYQINKTHKP